MNTAVGTESFEWHVVTCEFPPQLGGVADYAFTMSAALARIRTTHVWCPQPSEVRAEGIVVHAVLGHFSRSDLARVDVEMNALPGERRLFVQWVPHGFGYHSMNVGFALWLLRRAWFRGDVLDLMVHEPFSPWAWRPDRLATALVHRLMLIIAGLGATRVWVSTPSWVSRVRPYLLGRLHARWLAIPAPKLGAPQCMPRVPATRTHQTVGHLGTYSPIVTAMLEPALDVVLEESSADIVLIGRNSDRFLEQFLRPRPAFKSRMRATGTLGPEALGVEAAHCDLMLQPYPDGVSARRTSTLSLLQIGLPVVTNRGHLCEPFWSVEQCVELVDQPDGRRIGEAAAALLSRPERCAELSELARQTAGRLFDVSIALHALDSRASNRPFKSAHA